MAWSGAPKSNAPSSESDKARGSARHVPAAPELLYRVSAMVVSDEPGSVSRNALRPVRAGSAARTIAGDADVSA